MSYPKTILFAGYGRAGKDTAAEFLGRMTVLPYAGSFSWAALPFVAARMGIHPQVAWETRHQNRNTWYALCNELRDPDPTVLARLVLNQGSIAAGIRDKVEIDACKAAKLFDRIIWVDRPGTPVDQTVTFGPEDCHETILNGGTLEQFHGNLLRWADDHSIPLKVLRSYNLPPGQKLIPILYRRPVSEPAGHLDVSPILTATPTSDTIRE